MSLQDSPAVLCINMFIQTSLSSCQTQPKQWNFLTLQRRTFYIKKGPVPSHLTFCLHPSQYATCMWVFLSKKRTELNWMVSWESVKLGDENCMKCLLLLRNFPLILSLSLGQKWSILVKRLKEDTKFVQRAFCPPSAQLPVLPAWNHNSWSAKEEHTEHKKKTCFKIWN